MTIRVVELAKLVLENATVYEQCFASSHLPSPGLDTSTFPAPNVSRNVTAAKDAALEACAELQAILEKPVGIVRNLTATVNRIRS